MNGILKIVSMAALAATIVPSLLYFAGTLNHDAVTWAALIGTIVWFVVTPLWMGRETPPDTAEAKA